MQIVIRKNRTRKSESLKYFCFSEIKNALHFHVYNTMNICVWVIVININSYNSRKHYNSRHCQI